MVLTELGTSQLHNPRIPSQVTWEGGTRKQVLLIPGSRDTHRLHLGRLGTGLHLGRLGTGLHLGRLGTDEPGLTPGAQLG